MVVSSHVTHLATREPHTTVYINPTTDAQLYHPLLLPFFTPPFFAIEFQKRDMDKINLVVVLFALCVVPAIVTAHFAGDPFLVKGCVYCDSCRCGFETDVTKYMPGAKVRIECRDRDSAKLTYTQEAVTDESGCYSAVVQSDRGEDFCDAVLVKSSDDECSVPNAGRDRARVILTRNNGMTDNVRYANNMGFLKNIPLSNCAQILQKYQIIDN